MDRFLLAELHITNLSHQANSNALASALDTLPPDVTKIYARTLERVNRMSEIAKQLVYYTLSWVFYSPRPLTLIELRHALAISRLGRLSEESDLDAEDVIISWCAGLIVLNRNWLGKEEVHFLREFVAVLWEHLGLNAG
jgi:hypothetical protein